MEADLLVQCLREVLRQNRGCPFRVVIMSATMVAQCYSFGVGSDAVCLDIYTSSVYHTIDSCNAAQACHKINKHVQSKHIDNYIASKTYIYVRPVRRRIR